MDAIEVFLADEARRESWPGASWHIEQRGEVVSSGATGLRAILPEPAPAYPDTIYDLASLTKPLAVGGLLALLEQEHRLSFDAPAASFLAGLACDRDGRPTLLDLAAHRSGLPAWRPFYAEATTRGEILDRVLRLEPEAPCGSRVVYSDPGYILLGEVLERVTGRKIGELFREWIAEPLGLRETGFHPPDPLRNRIAPTELGNRHERELAARFVTDVDPSRFRSLLIHAEVHDGNAHALGGAAGHAGLFGTAAEVSVLAREFLGSGKGLFGSAALRRFSENLTPGLEEGRALGWKLAVKGAREADGALPLESFGHTGFTGTSVWLDRGSERVYVLLTNRVHPQVRATDMSLLRRRFHAIASTIF